ncbi:MAG: helix-turn-helix domain-containing protein [Gammaproteobacteria bacterium]|jgi:AraC-like DNA-binding protein
MSDLRAEIAAPDRVGSTPIQCSRAAHLFPYLAFLREVGAPVEDELRRARLPALLADDPDMYLPDRRLRRFLRAISEKEGIDDLAARAMTYSDLTDLSGGTSGAVTESPTLYSALKHFCRRCTVEDTFLSVWITGDETAVRVSCLNHVPLDAFARRIEDWGQLSAVIAIIRSFAGPEWQPAEIGLHSEWPVSDFAAQLFPNTRLLRGQRSAWVTVPRDLLSMSGRMNGDGMRPGLAAQAAGDRTERRPDLLSTLRAVLSAYLQDGPLAIDEVAEMAGISARTLQRRLRQAGMSFSELLQQVRFERAASFLRESDVTILEVALQVGYEDPSHFSRAFRRLAGVSPKQYRQQPCRQ